MWTAIRRRRLVRWRFSEWPHPPSPSICQSTDSSPSRSNTHSAGTVGDGVGDRWLTFPPIKLTFWYRKKNKERYRAIEICLLILYHGFSKYEGGTSSYRYLIPFSRIEHIMTATSHRLLSSFFAMMNYSIRTIIDHDSSQIDFPLPVSLRVIWHRAQPRPPSLHLWHLGGMDRRNDGLWCFYASRSYCLNRKTQLNHLARLRLWG